MVVLIPAYEPDNKLVELVRRLRHQQVVVVDDGSGPRYADIFATVRALGADLVTLTQNRGKGYALKEGFAHVRDRFPGQDVVCADSDGQHTPEDIQSVADRVATSDAAMVLGARRFTGKVPARSRFGNSVTCTAYRLVTGRSLIDTQTGLRGYPARMLTWLGDVHGERFEYELRLLLQAAREGLRIEEIEISTIYLEGNASSHFRPLRDSLRVYGPLLAFAASSVLAFIIDVVVLLAFVALTGSVVASAVVARLISATVNYGVNRYWVFGHGGNPTSRRVSAPRYALLALGVFIANVSLLKALTGVLDSLFVAKLITEVTLVAVSYTVQKYVVFPAPGARRIAERAVGPDDARTEVAAPALARTEVAAPDAARTAVAPISSRGTVRRS